MDDYIKCLYICAQENHIGKKLRTPEYHQAAVRRETKLKALEDMLSPEQQVALERFRSAETDLFFLEDIALFREGISLGMQMAR